MVDYYLQIIFLITSRRISAITRKVHRFTSLEFVQVALEEGGACRQPLVESLSYFIFNIKFKLKVRTK